MKGIQNLNSNNPANLATLKSFLETCSHFESRHNQMHWSASCSSPFSFSFLFRLCFLRVLHRINRGNSAVGFSRILSWIHTFSLWSLWRLPWSSNCTLGSAAWSWIVAKSLRVSTLRTPTRSGQTTTRQRWCSHGRPLRQTKAQATAFLHFTRVGVVNQWNVPGDLPSCCYAKIQRYETNHCIL